MKIDILTLFPEMFKEVFGASVIVRAQKKELITINTNNLRNWACDKHKTVDDTPYGGGAGMVLKVDVIDRALYNLKTKYQKPNIKNTNQKFKKSETVNRQSKIILLTPKGKTFDQKKAFQLSKCKRLILICGHYEGFDERVRKLVDEEISIGNYILTGGEIPAMVLIDSISRLVPGVINPESLKHESFSKIENYRLEYPQYTRPKIYKPISIKTKKPWLVPKILLSGNHSEIENWRIKNSNAKH